MCTNLNTLPFERAPYPIMPLWNLPFPDYQVPKAIASSTMTIVGDGPAAIIIALLRKKLGFAKGSTKIISPNGTLGGIWQYEDVLFEGHYGFLQIADQFDSKSEKT